jgi:hypothetical protein
VPGPYDSAFNRPETQPIGFEDEDAADAYLDGLVERLAENPTNAGAEEIEDAPRLGDESVAVAIFRETDGDEWVLNEVFVRSGPSSP